MIDRDDFENEEDYQFEIRRIAEYERQRAKDAADINLLRTHIKNSPTPTYLDTISGNQSPALAFEYILAEIARLREKTDHL